MHYLWCNLFVSDVLAAVSAASLISFSHRSRALMLEEVKQTVLVFKVPFVSSAPSREGGGSFYQTHKE